MQAVGFVHVGLANTNISHELTSRAVVAQRDLVAAAEETILRVGPWNGSICTLNLAQRLVERQALSLLAVLVVVAPKPVSSRKARFT